MSPSNGQVTLVGKKQPEAEMHLHWKKESHLLTTIAADISEHINYLPNELQWELNQKLSSTQIDDHF